MARLIINADDFGLTFGINRAVEELHRGDALTSATLMANGAAFDDAVRIAKQNPGLGVGCHIVLVDGSPVAPANQVSSLLEPGKATLRDSLVGFLIALHRGQIREEEIEREATAQIKRLQDAGIHPTHIDTHKHTHMFPRVLRPVLRAAQACGIRAIRNPIEPAWSAHLAQNAWKRRAEVAVLRIFQKTFFSQPQIASGAMKTTSGCLGVSATGSLDAVTLKRILAAMPEGTWELVTHPGYLDEDLAAVKTRLRETRDIEREALLRELPSSEASLVTFGGI